MAFSLKKEEQFVKAYEMVERLVDQYPKSTWVGDAKAMMIEIAPHLGKGEMIIQGINNDNDEIKITALVSLAGTNAARATAFASDILKADSKASLRLKETAISILGQRDDRQTLELLASIARGQADLRLRRAAIFALARSKDDSVLDLFKQLATAPDDSGVNRIAVFAISESANPRAEAVLREVMKSSPSPTARRAAIQALARKGGSRVVEEFVAAYDSEHDAETKRQILMALSQIDDPRVAAKISEVARGTDDHQLRRFAIYWMGQHPGGQGVQELIKLYDSRTDEGTRQEIIAALFESGQKPGLNKLMQIAKSDVSIGLRKRAILFLGRSKDPEAEKFIEDLLK
jgi:HEAT repeat protein